MTTHRPAPHRVPGDATVTAVLVSRNGGRWLPAVLDGLAQQTRAPDRVVAVDTGSTDGSLERLRERLGAEAVVSGSPTGGFGEAVALGLAATEGRNENSDTDAWVWLLHDDGNPAPDALEQLLAVARDRPDADVLGPKTREWPSLRRLLEVGVTLSGTGRRETGLERGEYDQGQHDEVRQVLAVTTAGMLVRRSVLASLGFDPRLPVLGADLDFGWRAARAGHRVLVAPAAVVFHAEASHAGVRRAPAVGVARRTERAAALYVLLANGPAPWLPLRAVRLLLGSLMRALGLLLVRAPGEALDELAAVGSVYARPGRLLAARRERRAAATVSHRAVRPLLAPRWTPYRHGLDAAGDLVTALSHEAGDRSAARRERRDLDPSPGVARAAARLALGPAGAVVGVLVVAALVSARGLVGGGALSGGALLPAPDSALDWWRVYLAGHHDLGTGSTAPAAPYLLPLAVAGTVLLGSASLLVDVLLLLAVPLAAWGGYRFLRRATGSTAASLWGAAAYAVLPVVTGAVQQGRLGTVVGLLVLPWAARTALHLAPSVDPDRRRRAAWRCALWLAVLVAFVPVAWPVAAVVGIVALVVTRGRLLHAVLVPLLAALVLLLPWSLASWSHQGPAAWLLEAGLPGPVGTGGPPDAWGLVLGRPGAGAPAWLSAGVLLAALAALLRRSTRPAVLRAWLVLVVALAAAGALAAFTVATSSTATAQPVWLGFPLALAQAAGITAAALAATGSRQAVGDPREAWRRPGRLALAALAGAAVLTPLLSVGWWVWHGSGGPLDRGPATDVPAYMSDAAATDPAQGVLVVRGDRVHGFSYLLLRQPGLRLGDDTVLPPVRDQRALTRTVTDLAAAPDPVDVRALSRAGVAQVFAPGPADPSLVANLDGLSGLSPGSATGSGSRAWLVEGSPSRAVLSQPGDPWRAWLLLAQAAALVAVVVLAAPSRTPSRGRR